MPRYRKKPIVVEVIRWDGEPATFMAIRKPKFNSLGRSLRAENGVLYVDTLEGVHDAQLGDWIIQGVNGEIYPCKPDIFEKTYESAD